MSWVRVPSSTRETPRLFRPGVFFCGWMMGLGRQAALFTTPPLPLPREGSAAEAAGRRWRHFQHPFCNHRAGACVESADNLMLTFFQSRAVPWPGRTPSGVRKCYPADLQISADCEPARWLQNTCCLILLISFFSALSSVQNDNLLFPRRQCDGVHMGKMVINETIQKTCRLMDISLLYLIILIGKYYSFVMKLAGTIRK